MAPHHLSSPISTPAAFRLALFFATGTCILLSACTSSEDKASKPRSKSRATRESTAKSPPTKAAHLYLPPSEAPRHTLDLRATNGKLASDVSFGPAPEALVPPSLARDRCPADMVAIDSDYCIDRFEASLVDARSGRRLSPHYPPTKDYTVNLFKRWTKKAPSSGRAMGREIPVPSPPAFQLVENFAPRARSQRGTLPAGYMSRVFAESACKNAGKRLCAREEWVRACQGEARTRFPYGDEYRVGVCNVHRNSHPAGLLHGDASRHHQDPRLGLAYDDDGPLLHSSGSSRECISRWGNDGVHDMVGNLDEWINEPSGSFLGGFFSRGTKSGCSSSIDSHAPSYLDYSLGTRCCQNQ